MQIIAEAYQLMKDGLGMTNDEMSEVYAAWNSGILESYLIEITADILGLPRCEGRSGRRLYPRQRGAKGHGQVDRRLRARSGRAAHARRRGGLRAVPLVADRRAQAGRRGTRQRVQAAATPTRPRSSPTSSVRCMARKSSRMPRAICSWPRRGKHTAGTSTWAASRSMWRGGCVDPQRVPRHHQGRLRRGPHARKPAARALLQPGDEGQRGRHGAGSFPRPSAPASPCLRSAARSPSSTGTAARGFPPT